LLEFSPWLPLHDFFFTVFAVLLFLSDVATSIRSYMSGLIPFEGAIKQRTDKIPQALKQ